MDNILPPHGGDKNKKIFSLRTENKAQRKKAATGDTAADVEDLWPLQEAFFRNNVLCGCVSPAVAVRKARKEDIACRRWVNNRGRPQTEPKADR